MTEAATWCEPPLISASSQWPTATRATPDLGAAGNLEPVGEFADMESTNTESQRYSLYLVQFS